MSDLAFDRDVQKILLRLKKLPDDYKKDRKSLLKKAAKPIRVAIKSKVKVGNKPHKRYDKNGKHVATYYPGNLKRSIRILNLKRSKDVFIGPRLASAKNPHGEFRGNKVDGYYGHMVEYGTVKMRAQPFMRPGFNRSKGRAQSIIQSGAARILKRYAARYRIA